MKLSSDYDDSADDSVDQAMPEFKRRRRSDSSPPENMTLSRETVPEDIQEKILSMLPARKVGEFRTVCKRWKVLTSIPHFTDMHSKHWYDEHPREILAEYSSSLCSFYLENSPSCSLTAGRILRGCDGHYLSFSALGFVVLHEVQDHRRVSILNPVTQEKVKLLVSQEDARLDGQVYAIFVHPKLQEICVLYGRKHRFFEQTTEFEVMNLKSSLRTGKSCWRSIIPRLHRYSPRRHRFGIVPPVIHNNVIYWMLECNHSRHFSCEDALLAFDVQTEQFQRLPHPGQYCAHRDEASIKHTRMNLLKTKGDGISLIEFCATEPYINIWERHSVEWTMKCRISASRGIFSNDSVLGMVDEEMVLLQDMSSRRLPYVLNLKQASLEALEEENDGHVLVCAHTPTFASMSSRGGEMLVQVPTAIHQINRRRHVIY